MTYDAENRRNPTSGSTFTYDGDGRRVAKSDGSVYWVDDNFRPLSLGTNTGSISKDFVFLGSKRIAMVAISSGNPYYYLSDHLSNRAEADSTGKIVRTYGSYPFGATWYETGTPDKFKFTSYEFDSETGLQYAEARLQSPRIGRFLGIDPLAGHLGNPQSLNRYSYVANDPINFIDPSGMEGEDDDPCWFGCDSNSDELLPLDGSGPWAPVNDDQAPSASISLCFPACNDEPIQSLDDIPLDLSAFSDLSDAVTSDSFVVTTGSVSGVQSDAFEEGSLAYTVFQGSSSTWAAADNTVHDLTIGYGLGFLGLAGAAAAPSAIALGTGVYYGFGGIGAFGTGAAVLGRNPEYLDEAEEMGAAALNMPGRLWNFLDSLGESWTANKAFLDTVMYRGMNVYFASPLSKATFDSNFWQELQYLSGATAVNPSAFANPFMTSLF